MGEQVRLGLRQVRHWLQEGPLHLSGRQLQQLEDQLAEGLRLGQEGAVSRLLGGARTAGEVAAGLVLMLFSLFFFLKDGAFIARWARGRMPARFREDLTVMAGAARDVMRSHMVATGLTGVVNGILIGLALAVIGVPLVVPLAVLTFAGAFFPLVGAFVAGIAAALVALVTGGPADAALVVGATILVQQVEGNLLQPLILGRAVRLHPLVTAWSVAGGPVVAGIVGGFLAVPVVAFATRVVHFYRCRPAPTEAD